jgi:1-acyl-sn-glycerol-3-phosphate acyltransferase
MTQPSKRARKTTAATQTPNGAARAPRAKALKVSAPQATVKVPPTPAALNGRRPKAVPERKSVAERRREAPRAAEPVDVWDERVAGFLSFLRRRVTGQYEVDDFGFDRDLTESVVYPPLRLLYERYFRVETVGAHHLPAGGALIVANHSGTLPMDALMLSLAVHDETPDHRHLRLLGADLVFRIPILSELARKGGTTLACTPDAQRLLRAGEYVGVFPEGYKGLGKPFRDRYNLQRFGRGGFVAAALRTGLPIVPVSIVGAEEIYPIIGNLKPLARMANLPYFPITPLFPWFGPLGAVPLPSKWFIEFGQPIPTKSLAGEADDPIVVFNLADQVRETIQETLRQLLRRRADPFA